MQCGAKMNMVTFSAFEKQICNILHLLHKFRTHAGSSSHAGSGKILPTPLENPARNPYKKAERPPREPPSSPPHQPQKRPKLRVKNSMEPPTGKLHRYHVFL